VYEVAEDAGGAEELISKFGVPPLMFKGLDWDSILKGKRDLSFAYNDGKWTKWKDYGEEIGYTAWGRVEEKPKHEHEQRCQSRWAQVLESVKNVLRGEPDVKTDLESPEEVDAAAADLEAGAQRSLSKDYEERVKETLLQNSANTKDYNAAKLEWDFINSWEDFPGQCELCGYNPIRYHFLIRNRLNSNELAVGSECFPPGAPILTKNGYIPIEIVSVGDEVYTHEGRFRQVTNRTWKNFSGDLVVLKIANWIGSHKITPEHPVLTRNGWTLAKDVCVGDYVFVKFPVESSVPEFYQQAKLHKRFAKKLPTTDPDFWWLVGLYLAEGSLAARIGRPDTMGCVYFSLHEKEVEEVCNKVKQVFGIKNVYSRQIKDSKAWVSQVPHSGFYQFLEKFGCGASHKTVPGWVDVLPPALRISMLNGYLWGDGSYYREGYCSANTVSKNLAHDIQRLWAITRGVVPSMNKIAKEKINNVIEGRVVNVKDQYKLGFSESNLLGRNRTSLIVGVDRAFSDSSGIWIKVVGVEKEHYDGPVFNLEVEEDNSYTTHLMTVHNCITNYLVISELGKSEIRLMVKRLKSISQEKRASQPDILDTESRVQMKFGQIRRAVANPDNVKIPSALSILGRAAMSLQRFGLRLAKDLAAFLQKLRDAAARLRAKFKTLDYAEAANKIIRDEPDPTKAEKDLDDLNETIQLANKYGPENELQERVKSSVDDAFKALPNRIRDIAFEIRRNLEAKLGEAEKVATAFPRVVNRIEDLRAKIHTTLDKMVRDILVQIAQGQPAELPTEKILKQTLNDEDRRWLEFMTETFLNPEGLPFEDVRSFLGVGADVQGPDMTSVERRMLWMQAYNENIYTSPTLPGKDIGMDDQMRDILFGINPIYEKLAMGGKSTSEVPMAENSDRAVAEMQADPDFRALTPREQNFLMNFLGSAQGDNYADGANFQNDLRSYGYKNVTRLLSLYRRHYPDFVKK
jgi:intein/homing endonuclease